MALNIKIGHFCGLSTNSDFRNWLKGIAPDLLQMLLDVKRGCRAKQEKMVEIHKKLYERDLGDALENFIQKRFPYMVDMQSQSVQSVQTKSQPKQFKQPIQTESKVPVSGHIETLNKHKVFKRYRPDLLTFPHKYIIISNPDTLLDNIKSFIHDKVGVDYLIIDDHAYIEYFTKRYSDVAESIKPEDREIWIYRQRMKQN